MLDFVKMEPRQTAVRPGRAALVASRKDRKRELILVAARKVFEAEGLDGASLRAIAAEAGYTPAALYFHFASKEAIYAELLHASLAKLGEAVNRSVERVREPKLQLREAILAFFRFYADRPRELDLGFYLFRGGMKPAGLGRERDEELNAALESTLRPVAKAAVAMGASKAAANLLMVEAFAHAAGLLLLLHTGRIRMFNASATALMDAYVQDLVVRLEKR